MSRTGPAYVENEAELEADLELKVNNGEISESTAEAFLDLYEFGEEVGDNVTIGGRKHANFQVFVDAHQGDYRNDPSVFTAIVNKEITIWPARMPMDHEGMDSVSWSMEDYKNYKRAFNSLRGIRDSVAVDFQEIAANGELEEFKEVVQDFVDTCREKHVDSA